jgi:hypothetical protein
VQASVQSLFEVASFLAGSLLRRPAQFPALMGGSCAAVAGAGALYAAYCCRRPRTGGGAAYARLGQELAEVEAGSGGPPRAGEG